MANDSFKFPDELEEDNTVAISKADDNFEIDIEIEDDTPPEDRNRQPMPKEIVESLDKDELDKYDEEVQEKLKQARKIYHDERREKEQAARERQAAIDYAKQVAEENKRLKSTLYSGEKEYVESIQTTAGLEVQMAKRAYKEAYDAGDSDALLEAQQNLMDAQLKLDRAKNFKLPSLQKEEFSVQSEVEPQVQVAAPDNRARVWQERNSWFGQDEEMTATALGLHEKLRRNGVVVGSDEYYSTLDKTMRKRFPEQFEEPEEVKQKVEKPKSSTIVAPAVRSTASNKIKLKSSQVLIAKKLGLTPEQYAIEARKLES
jgi:hypothetical protein